ncbi:MAG: hypothetical protein KY476_15300 [Planctomycetes bacterium]|nr:hypothetical protein [Planctomycetota bacterium]
MSASVRLKTACLTSAAWSCVVSQMLLAQPDAKRQAVETPAEQAKAVPPPPIEKRPYRVRIAVAFGREASLTTAFRRDMLDELSELIERSVGGMWQTTVEEADEFQPASRSGLERLAEDVHLRRLEQSPADRVFFMTVAAAGPRLDIAARMWNAQTRQLGAVAGEAVYRRELTAVVALGLIERLFRPVLEIDRLDAETGKLHLRLQASRLVASSEEDSILRRQLAVGDVLTPFFRYLDKQQVVQRIQFLPWTYLAVESIDGGRVVCEVVAGFRVPLGASRRRTVESLAVAVRAEYEATELTLLPQVEPARPLVGHYVVVAPKKYGRDEPMTGFTKLLTDREGRVRIPADPERPLVWLYISSGTSLLARVPFVPGIEPETSIQVPDDSIRLAVEGEIAQLKGRLIDAVARQYTILGRAKLYAKKGDGPRVEAILAELDTLPTVLDFRRELTTIRVPAVEACRKRGDRLNQRRIETLCNQTSELVDRYLDPAKPKELREEIEELLAAAK